MIVSKKVVLEPQELDDIKRAIQSKLRFALENTLIGEGFVIRVNDIKRISQGVVQHSPACAVEYTVHVDVELFDVNVGDVVDVTINNVNGMGIFGIHKQATVFVPLHEVERVDDTDNILHVVGDVVNVKIVGKRITDTILCIGTERFENAF
jgi:DNA-directed RNA polymerase subunit E'/Rpb7